jgi:hypothetical protein
MHAASFEGYLHFSIATDNNAGVPPPEMGVGFAIEYSMRCTNQPAIWWDQDKASIPKTNVAGR